MHRRGSGGAGRTVGSWEGWGRGGVTDSYGQMEMLSQGEQP